MVLASMAAAQSAPNWTRSRATPVERTSSMRYNASGVTSQHFVTSALGTTDMSKPWSARYRAALQLLGEWLAQVFVRAIAVYALAVVISLAFIALERAATAATPPMVQGAGTVHRS